MQNSSNQDGDIRKFFWRPQKSNVKKTNETSMHDSQLTPNIPSKKFTSKQSFDPLNLSDFIAFETNEMSQNEKKFHSSMSKYQPKAKLQFQEAKQKEKQAKKKLRQLHQQLDKLMRLKKKREKKQLKEQEKMKQIASMLKENQFPDAYHLVYDEEQSFSTKDKRSRKPIKYVRFLKNQQPIPKMSKEEFIKFGKRRIIAKVMSNKGYSMRDITEEVRLMNSPTIREITRTEMKNQSFNIVAATIRKLQSFLRVFAKKLPMSSNTQAFPLKKFLKKQSIKNKSHFIMNFTHRFEIAHKMTFMKFLFLEFRLQDVEISPQEAVDLVVYLGRNIEDPNYGYEKLVDVEEKIESGKEGEFQAEEEFVDDLEENIRALEEEIMREQQAQGKYIQPQVPMERFNKTDKDWQNDFKSYDFLREISKLTPKYPNTQNNKRDHKSDFDYRNFYKNLTQAKKNLPNQQAPTNEVQHIQLEQQSFNEEYNYQEDSCRANYYPEIDETERSLIDQLKGFQDTDEQDLEDFDHNQARQQQQIQYQQIEEQDETNNHKYTKNETQKNQQFRQYERFYVQKDRNRKQKVNQNQETYSKSFHLQPSPLEIKKSIVNFVPNWPNNLQKNSEKSHKNLEQFDQYYQEDHQNHGSQKKDQRVSRQKTQKEYMGNRMVLKESAHKIQKAQSIREECKSIKKSRNLNESIVREIQVIELQSSNQEQDLKPSVKPNVPKQNPPTPNSLHRQSQQKSMSNPKPVQAQTISKPKLTLTQQQQEKIKYYKLLDEQIIEIVLRMKNGKPHNDQQQDQNCRNDQSDISINRITYYMNKKYHNNPTQSIQQNSILPKQFTPELILSRVAFIFTAVSQFTNHAFLTYLKSTEKNQTNNSKKKPTYNINQILFSRLKDSILILFVKEQETQKIQDKKILERKKNVINLDDNHQGEQEDSPSTETPQIDEDRMKQAVSKMNERMKKLLFEEGMKKIITQKLSNFFRNHLLKFTQTTSSKKKPKSPELKYHRVAISAIHKSFLQTYFKFYQAEKYSLEEKKKRDPTKDEHLGRYFEEMMPLLMDFVDEIVGGKKEDKKESKKGKRNRQGSQRKNLQIQENTERQLTERIENGQKPVEKTVKKRGRKPKNKTHQDKQFQEEPIITIQGNLSTRNFKQSNFSLIQSIKNQNQPSSLKQSISQFLQKRDTFLGQFHDQTINDVEQQKIENLIRAKLEKKKLKKARQEKFYDAQNEGEIDQNRYLVPIELQLSTVQQNYDIYDEEEDQQLNQLDKFKVNQVQKLKETDLSQIQKNKISFEDFVWSDAEESPVNLLIQLENQTIQPRQNQPIHPHQNQAIEHYENQTTEAYQNQFIEFHEDQYIQSYENQKPTRADQFQQVNPQKLSRLKSNKSSNVSELQHGEIDLSKYMVFYNHQTTHTIQQVSPYFQQPTQDNKKQSEIKQSHQNNQSISKTKPIQKASKSAKQHNKSNQKLKIVKVDPIPKNKQSKKVHEKLVNQSKTKETKKTAAKVSKPPKPQISNQNYIVSSESSSSLESSESSKASTSQDPKQKPPQCQPSSPQTSSSSQIAQYQNLGEKLKNIESYKMTKEEEEKMLAWYMQNNRKEVEQMMKLYLSMQNDQPEYTQKDQENEGNHQEEQNNDSPHIDYQELLQEDDEKLIYFNDVQEPTQSQSAQYIYQNLSNSQLYQLNSNEEQQLCFESQKVEKFKSQPIKTRTRARMQQKTQNNSKLKSKPKTKKVNHRK